MCRQRYLHMFKSSEWSFLQKGGAHSRRDFERNKKFPCLDTFSCASSSSTILFQPAKRQGLGFCSWTRLFAKESLACSVIFVVEGTPKSIEERLIFLFQFMVTSTAVKRVERFKLIKCIRVEVEKLAKKGWPGTHESRYDYYFSLCALNFSTFRGSQFSHCDSRDFCIVPASQ